MSWNELVTCHPIELNFEKEFCNEVVNFPVELEGFAGFNFRGSAVVPLSAGAQVKMLVAGDTTTANYTRHHMAARHVLQTNLDAVYGSYALVAPDLIDCGLVYYHMEGSYYSAFGHFMYQINFRAEETSPVVSSTIYTLQGSTLYTGSGDKNVVQITSSGMPVSCVIRITRFY